MALSTEVTLLNNDNSKKINLRLVSGFKPKKSQPVIPIPLVNTTPANTFLFRFQGQSEEVTFSFGLVDDGTDVSGGTHTSTVTTINEQVDYIKNNIFTDNFDVSWTLTENRHYPSGVTCVITNLEFDDKPGTTQILTGSITVMLGRIGIL